MTVAVLKLTTCADRFSTGTLEPIGDIVYTQALDKYVISYNIIPSCVVVTSCTLVPKTKLLFTENTAYLYEVKGVRASMDCVLAVKVVSTLFSQTLSMSASVFTE